ncbi:MAG: hypothetical protein NTY22_07540 [Proteobacteria bacterium]|nr:hypothetical protein [Pseudomonadota bacterium]
MKTMKIISLISIMALAAACGSKHVNPQPEPKTYDLLKDDGIGIIFTSTETTNSTPAQIKISDNQLSAILKGETFPGSTGNPNYVLQYVEESTIAIFGVPYAGSTIDKILCVTSTNPQHQYQLQFGSVDSASPWFNGIPWTDLVNLNGAPIIADVTIPCSGGGISFNLNVFKEGGISDPDFALYFDFVNIKFRGRMVLTEPGLKPEIDGVVLNFR